LPLPTASPTKPNVAALPRNTESTSDPANSGIRREPELPEHEEVVPEPGPAKPEFEFAGEEDADDETQRAKVLRQQAVGVARQVALDPDDGLGM
jgi:type IV secretion system protein VirD4